MTTDETSEYVFGLCVLAMHLMEQHGDRVELTQDEIDRAKARLDPGRTETLLVTSGHNFNNTVVCEIRSRSRQTLVVEVDPPQPA